MNIHIPLIEKTQNQALCDRLNIEVERDEQKVEELAAGWFQLERELAEVRSRLQNKQQSLFQIIQEIASLIGSATPMGRAARNLMEGISTAARVALGRRQNQLENEVARLDASKRNLERALADVRRQEDNRRRLAEATRRAMTANGCRRTSFWPTDYPVSALTRQIESSFLGNQYLCSLYPTKV